MTQDLFKDWFYYCFKPADSEDSRWFLKSFLHAMGGPEDYLSRPKISAYAMSGNQCFALVPGGGRSPIDCVTAGFAPATVNAPPKTEVKNTPAPLLPQAVQSIARNEMEARAAMAGVSHVRLKKAKVELRSVKMKIAAIGCVIWVVQALFICSALVQIILSQNLTLDVSVGGGNTTTVTMAGKNVTMHAGVSVDAYKYEGLLGKYVRCFDAFVQIVLAAVLSIMLNKRSEWARLKDIIEEQVYIDVGVLAIKDDAGVRSAYREEMSRLLGEFSGRYP